MKFISTTHYYDATINLQHKLMQQWSMTGKDSPWRLHCHETSVTHRTYLGSNQYYNNCTQLKIQHSISYRMHTYCIAPNFFGQIFLQKKNEIMDILAYVHLYITEIHFIKSASIFILKMELHIRTHMQLLTIQCHSINECMHTHISHWGLLLKGLSSAGLISYLSL